MMVDEKNDDGDVRELMEGLEKVEQTRRRRALAIGLTIAALLLAIGVLATLFSDTFFRPELDIVGGEEDVLAETNDPECRGFIDKLTAIESDYRALEPEIERMMETDDPEELRQIVKTTSSLRDRIDAQEVASKEATLRFDESRQELDDWFGYIDNELALMGDLAEWRLEDIGSAQPATRDGSESDAAPPDTDRGDNADAGSVEVVHVEAKPEGRPTGAARIEASSKTPKELHEGSMLAVHEAFQSFRVWHTGSLHPCGTAGEGETGWTPAGQSDSAEVTK